MRKINLILCIFFMTNLLSTAVNAEDWHSTERINLLKKQIEACNEHAIKNMLAHCKLTPHELNACIQHLLEHGAHNIDYLENPESFPFVKKFILANLLNCFAVFGMTYSGTVIALGTGIPPQAVQGAVGLIDIPVCMWIFWYMLQPNIPERIKNLRKLSRIYRLLMRHRPESQEEVLMPPAAA